MWHFFGIKYLNKKESLLSHICFDIIHMMRDAIYEKKLIIWRGYMKNKRLSKLYNLLSENEYKTAEYISEKMELSSKTIRNLIKDLDSEISTHGVKIKSKHGFGYKIEISDKELYDEFFKDEDIKEKKEEYLPNNSEERIQYLLEYLLNCKEYIKIEELSSSLYISKKTLTCDLKEVEKILNEYNIHLERKPNYGIKAYGKEFDARLCMAGFIAKDESFGFSDELTKNHKEDMKLIAENLTKCLREEDFSISNIAFQNLVVHIYIAVMRIRENYYVPLDRENIQSYYNKEEYILAQKIVDNIKILFNVNIPEAEIGYIAIHLAGKRMKESNQDSVQDNIVIGSEVNYIVVKMLKIVYDAFKFDFRNDLELIMALCQHIVPLTVRIKHDMNMKNPLLKEIKERYSLSYAMAAAACTVLNQCYNKNLKDDEIGYIALSFELALERQKNTIEKKNILLVCASGKGSAQLLLYKYKSEFGEYINTIETCDVNSIYKIDFKKIDYVFTTVPIESKISVPIMEVKYFLEDEDIKAVKKVLAESKESLAVKYYDRNLFFSCLKCTNKNEVLKYMCDCIKKEKNLPDEFYESVLKRESLAPTEFFNMVAMPHPYVAMGEETFMSVAILDKPILWNKKEVQVIFLLSIGTKKKNDIQQFYSATSKMIMKCKSIKEIIKKRDFETLIKLLNETEREEKIQ